MGAPDGEHQIGPYRLLSLIGAGGFGAVHLALDPEGRTVAVKILHPHVAADATALARLAREVETMRRVRGPHVAEVLDASLSGGRPYLVTRYVQGRALATVVAADGPLAGDDLVRLARGLAAALVAVHDAGVIHRDLKPGNVIVADGEPVVIDFGIACALDSASVTVSGAVLGTPGFLAPEVLEGEEVTAAADVFSLAATLAFAATGRQPYGAGPPSAVAYRVVHHEADLSGVPPWLAPLLRDCLRIDPAARPTAHELLARLAGYPAPGLASAGGSAAPRRRGRGKRAAATGSAGLGTEHPLPPVDPARPAYPGLSDIPGRAGPAAMPRGGGDDLATREWRPGAPAPRPAPEEALARHRARIHRRWVIGTGLLAALVAAASREHLPEVSLLVLAVFGCAMLIDAGVALFSRRGAHRGRMVIALGTGVGTVALWAVLTTVFSTFVLVLALATVLAVLVVLLVAG
jgi:hypothetical protein